MAAGIRSSRSHSPAESPELAGAAERLQSLQHFVAALIDRDAVAYSSVIAARRMPEADVEARLRRRTAIESAMRVATDAPLETMRACSRALGDAPVVAAHCTRSTRADVGVAIELLRAAVRGAGLTIEANLGSLADAEYVARVRVEREALDSRSAFDAEHALSQLSERLA
jgi:formiminotetrahydrofolate cyclodeaminase